MPNETHVAQFLDEVAARWRLLARLRLVARAALGIGLLWLAGITLWWLVGRTSLGQESLVIAVVALATAGLVAAVRWFLPKPPARTDVARLVEERVPDLNDRLATAADVLERGGAETETPVARALFEDTTRALGSVSASDVIPPELVRRAWWQAAAASLLLLVTGAVLIEPASRAARAAWLFASPGGLAFRVEPGNVRVRPGTPLTIRVQARPPVGSLVPDLEARIGDASRRERMSPEGNNRFAATFKSVPASFTYHVQLAGRRSAGLPGHAARAAAEWRASTCRTTSRHSRACLPRSETDGGDIYAPEGTRVHLVVYPARTTAPIASAGLAMRYRQDAAPVAGRGRHLHRRSRRLGGRRVSREADRHRRPPEPEDPEYFVRMLDDRPPEVRIVRPPAIARSRRSRKWKSKRAQTMTTASSAGAGVRRRGRRRAVVPLGGDGAARVGHRALHDLRSKSSRCSRATS